MALPLNAATNQPRPRRRGQSTTEVLVIVSLIAIAVIGVLSLFNNNVRRMFGISADTMAGEQKLDNRNAARSGENKALTNKGMKNATMNSTSAY